MIRLSRRTVLSGVGAALAAIVVRFSQSRKAKAEPGPRNLVVLPGLSADGTKPFPGGATTAVSTLFPARLLATASWDSSRLVRFLSKGSAVFPIARYGDFVHVALASGEEGWLAGWAVPDGIALPARDLAELPPSRPDLARDLFSAGVIIDSGDVIHIDNRRDGFEDHSGGPHPLVAGLAVTFRVETDGGAGGSVKLVSRKNSGATSYWEGVRRLDIGSQGGSMYMQLQDGTSATSSRQVGLGIPEQAVTLSVLDARGQVFSIADATGAPVVTVDVREIPGLALSEGLFPEAIFYFGTSTSPRSRMSVHISHVSMPPDGRAPARAPLQDLFMPHGITVGTDLLPWRVEQDDRYRVIAAREFNLVDVGQFSDTNVFWLGRGKYDWAYLDGLMSWYQRLGWKVRAMHLVWGPDNRIPGWLKSGTFSKAEYLEILREYITDVVTRYRDQVDEWSIANEYFSRLADASDFWNVKIGPEYVPAAFAAARNAAPDALLVLNEADNHEPNDARSARIVESMYAAVRDWKASGVPIDAVGMQMHLLMPWNSPALPSKVKVVETMQRFASLGVSILITELDVSVHALPGTMAGRFAAQSDIYRTVASACIESGACRSFTTFGISDRDSWITDPGGAVKLTDAEPLLWDREYRPKPALDAVWDILAG